MNPRQQALQDRWADTRLTGPSSAHGMDDAERDERHDMLTAAPRIVRNGLDYQGRAPEAAHAATGMGADDEDAAKQFPGLGAVIVPVAFALIGVVGWAVVARMGWLS